MTNPNKEDERTLGKASKANAKLRNFKKHFLTLRNSGTLSKCKETIRTVKQH